MANPKRQAHRAAAAASKPRAEEPQTVHEPEVVGAPVSEEQQLVSSNYDTLMSFLSGAAAFFRKANQLEAAARDRLTEVQKFEGDLKAAGVRIPRDADEDARAQTLIRSAKVGRQATDAFWSITSVLSKLHKATVAGRERAGQLDDQAAEIAQRLHNGYTDEAKRKAREQEEADRRAAEQRAREERDREQAELERKALEAEASSPTLSEREQRFVDQMVAGAFGPVQCARLAGYKNFDKVVDQLLASPKIKAAIDAKKQAENIRQQAAAKREMPLDVQVEPVKPDIRRATPGGHDRTTWSAEVFDADAFMAAVLDPMTRTKLGIPANCATFHQVNLNEAARGLHEKMNVWPGVRAKKTTTTV